MSYSPKSRDLPLYNASATSLRNWRNAYAKQKNGEGHAHMVFYGDSVTNGYQGQAPFYINSWPARVKALIDAKTGFDKGTGFVSSGELSQGGGENRFSETGSWISAGFGPSNKSIASNSGSATFTIGPIICDRIRVYYAVLGNGGVVTATMDAGAVASFNCGGANAVGFIDYTIASGSHTLVLTGPVSTASYIYVVGFEAFKNGVLSGVRNSNLGYNATQVTDLVSQGSAFNSLPTSMDSLAPDLAFISYGANDVFANNPAAFQAGLQTAITRARSLNSDVILVTMAPVSSATVAQQQSYIEAMYTLADINDVCVLDINRRFGLRGSAVTEALMVDPQHPNSRGYYDISVAVATALLTTTVL